GEYEPRKPDSLDDVPSSIRKMLEGHLIERLGKTFYSSLQFDGGQIVDYDDLLKVHPNAKNYKWEVHAYDLHFAFRKPEIGVKLYVAQIALRGDGSILHEINLPNFSSAYEKLNFVSIGDALNEAKKYGHNSKSRIEFIYLEEFDSLVWRFSRVVN